jgi:hypothetical protein
LSCVKEPRKSLQVVSLVDWSALLGHKGVTGRRERSSAIGRRLVVDSAVGSCTANSERRRSVKNIEELEESDDVVNLLFMRRGSSRIGGRG